MHELIIVGAGVAGLSLARQWRDRSPVVLDRGAGVGGRCATRRVEGRPVDHGVSLIHGRSREFLAAMEELEPADTVPDWPFHVRGPGTPCQPQAFGGRSRRLALARGISAFPKQLARDLDVRLHTRVEGLEPVGHGLAVHTDGETLEASKVVLTCPLPQVLDLVLPLAGDLPELASLVQVMRRVHLLPCLTVLAGYHRSPATDWHLMLPGPGSPLHTLINESSKRSSGPEQVLVLQASPAFSRQNLDRDPEAWTAALLAEAGLLLGEWAEQPVWSQGHGWRYARVQRGDELSHPVLITLPGGAVLGLCGEAWNGAGGLEGAYLSGLELARRLAAPVQPLTPPAVPGV